MTLPRKTTLFLGNFCFFLIILPTLQACTKSKIEWTEPAVYQHYTDSTKKYVPRFKGKLKNILFTAMDRDRYSDLILIREDGDNKNQILTFLWKKGKGFIPYLRNGLDRFPKINVERLIDGDFNLDGKRDLILLGKIKGESAARYLLNNGKGYFYNPKRHFPSVHNGIENGVALDLDSDGDQDILFFGRLLKNKKNNLLGSHAQLMLNNGKGEFEDVTQMLLPPLRKGIIGISIADYDGDLNPDIFWINGNGSNVLWINNGLGKFVDQSRGRLPKINAKYTSADWADFDMDGDNDLLVTTHGIARRNQAFRGEFCFFLENDGKARFRKRSLKLLPKFPSGRVYILDADGNNSPDILILSRKKVYYYIGVEPWTFSDETVKRLPYGMPFDEFTFGDINGDRLLDIFGILSKNKKGRLWVDKLN